MGLFDQIPDASEQEVAAASSPAAAPSETPPPDYAEQYVPPSGPSPAQRTYESVSPYIPEYVKQSARSLYEGPRNRLQELGQEWEEAKAAPPSGSGNLAGAAALLDPIQATGANAGMIADELRSMWNSRLGTRDLPVDYDPYKYYNAEEAAKQQFAEQNPATAKTIGAVTSELPLSHPYGISGRPPSTGIFDDIKDEPGTPNIQASLCPRRCSLGDHSAAPRGRPWPLAPSFKLPRCRNSWHWRCSS